MVYTVGENLFKDLTMADVFFCEITEIKVLTDAVYSITVKSREIAKAARPGQFLHIKCGHSRILRRPISICYVKNDDVNFVFEAKGEGTKWLTAKKQGEILNILGPLGTGFNIPDEKLLIVGGGVGTPPMLFAAQSAKNEVTAILGFRSADRVILTEEFKQTCKDVFITTDDGSVGIHGPVTKPLEELLQTGEYKTVLSCGQILMQKAVADICKKYNVSSQVSLEERMGCGVGACLVCACATYLKADPGNMSTTETANNTTNTTETITMSRVCLDGPVFSADDVVWNEVL